MTAIVAYAARDAGWILNDTAVGGDPAVGAITGRQVSKVVTFPHSQIIAASRGAFERTKWAQGIVERMASFDELEDALLNTIKAEWPGDDRYAMGLELVALGWSARANRYLIAHVHAPGFTCGRVYILLAPNPDWDATKISSLFPDGPAPAGTSNNLLATMTAQRDYLLQLPGGVPIGGWAVETMIRGGGIRQRLVHRWPDAAV